MTLIPELSERLRAILDFELARGNTIESVYQPGGSRSPVAVILKRPLDIEGFTRAHGLPAEVETWENRDSHYALEAGYVCRRSRHTVAGPIA